MSTLPESKVPGSRCSRNRAAQAGEISWSLKSTPPKPTAPRRLGRRPFPRVPFRRFYRWPEGLAYAVGMNWTGAV